MSHILTPDLEAQTLAMLALAAMNRNAPFTSVAFKQELPTAYECLKATKAFLQKMEEEAKAEAEVFWNSEEGRKRREAARARFEEFRKKNQIPEGGE
jgi:hypothetical protein